MTCVKNVTQNDKLAKSLTVWIGTVEKWMFEKVYGRNVGKINKKNRWQKVFEI